jgi:tripartite-type tricarboxylate transporter receptor subunit TctC
MIQYVRAVTVALAALLPFGIASAQMPSTKLQIVVPYGPGNGLDLLARDFAEAMRSQLGMTVVVENREGAGGVVGTSYVTRAAPDGQTILFTANPPFVSAPMMQKQPAYDPLTSFLPVAKVGSVPLVLVTSSHSPFKTFQQMKEFVVRNPDKANYADSGIGSPGQLYTELIKQSAQLPMLREIPYKSTGQAMIDVIAGNVLVSLVSYPAASTHLKAGTIRLLAVGSPHRLKDHPDVSTLAEALGQPGFEANVWYGIFAPAGMSPDRVRRLYSDIAKVHNTPALVASMNRSSITPLLLSPGDFAASLRRDSDLARRMLEASKQLIPE